jgi:predicted alpha-1,2-mannosidase
MPRSRLLVRAATAAALVSGGALIPLCATSPASAASGPSYVKDPASLVNPFIGTSNGGDVFPGADLPFGMIQWSPDTPSRPSGGGYEYTDNSITGYSLSHLSGPGCGAEDDVPILPTTGAVPSDPSSATQPLDHSQETATPGYYSLDAGGVTTQLSTTTRAGIAKFAFPSGTSAGNLLFKLSDSGAPDSATHFQVVSNKEISGYVTTGDFCGATNQYTLHFDMTFNRPITGYGTWTNGSTPQANVKTLSTKLTAAQQATARKQAKVAGLQALSTDGLAGSRNSANGKLRANGSNANAAAAPPVTGADGAYLTFDTTSASTVTAKVGISYVSTDNASANLAQEIPDWNFATVKSAAHSAWNQALGKIQVAGGTATQQTVFYTALYHSLLHPNVASDDNGQYMGFDGQVHTTAQAHPIYANYSGWDIYRSQSQLEAMLFPQQMSDTVTSMLDDYNQTGMLPKWSEDNGESYVMVGDPSDPIIADAYAFGARKFDTTAALTDMQTEAGVPNNIRPGLNYYLNQGYLPIDGTYGCCNFYGPVSTQEEYNAADNAIASFASSLGNSSVASTFATRANNWQNVYNPGSGFLQPKLADGAFQSGFDPTSSNGFVEADAYVYAAELPFDVAGLVKAEGGDANWTKFLDGLTSSVTGMSATQAQLGNEPSFDIPWEYDYVGAPDKAQEVVREVQDQLYTNTPGGLAGNDDLGAMSSWYVWSAIGAYPETPGDPTTALGSPEFTAVKIHLGNGNTVTESAPQAADNAPYVQSMSVNGNGWNNAYLPADMFTQGGTIDWTLGTTPSTTFADTAAAAPPSDTSGLLPALGDVGGPDNSSLEVVNPGDSTNLTLGVQSMTSGSQTINWTATTTSGSGLQVGPTSGSLIVGSEKQVSQQVGVTVPSDTPDGQYQVTFHLQTATGTALPNVVEDIGVAQPGDMAPYYNDTGISSDTDQGAANFDGDGFSYSEQALAAQGVTLGGGVTADGVQYTFPSAAVGTPDSVTAGGQTIKVLPVSGATTIGFLGSATNGPSTGQLTINYTDGSSQTVTLGFSDWTLNANGSPPSYGNVEVANAPYRNSVGGTSQTVNTYLLSASFPLTAGKTVASVTLPASANQGSLHVFAIGSDAGPLTK